MRHAIDLRHADACELQGLPDVFDTVLDSARFHCFAAETDRVRYAAALHRACRPGARLYLWCFSGDSRFDRHRPRPNRCGTHGVSLAELERAFAPAWSIESVEHRSATLARGADAGERWFWLVRGKRSASATPVDAPQ